MSTGSQKRVTDQFPLFETASQRHQVPLLEPKFHAPRLHATLVERKRLLEKLDAALQGKLTLLCAPAGFGKTTLISQWMENNRVRGQGLPVAWVSLESSDNDPMRFWRYIITACQSLHADLGQASLAQPSADLPPFEIPSLEMVLTLLLNNIARFASSRLLILEDYHLITESHIHETMTFFLDHLPAQLHVVILTRSEPPLPLVRWRARGELAEMHAADLRFSREEMANFFQRVLAFSPSILPAEAFNQLETRLEGWAAGLRLLALALQGSANQQGVEHVITTFAGEQRSFQDYFVTEVLSVQPEALQDFLLHTSILSRLTGSLCDAVAERHESDRLLEDIERAGIFLESLDRSGEWYRYHALFAEAMQAEARRRLGVGVLHALSLKASRWYEQQRMFAEAVEAAFQAQDTTRAAELIEHILGKVKHFILGPQVFQEVNGFHTLRRWLEQLPETAFRGRPLLYLGYATALLFVFVVDQLPPTQVLMTKIEEALQMAEEEFRSAGDMPKLGGVFAFQALIAREQGAIREAITYARESLAWLPEEDREWRNLSLNVIGVGKLLDGQLEQAQKIFLELCALCEAFGNRAILRANTALLNIVSYEQGKLRQTAEFFRQMLAEAREEGDRDDIAHASLLLAWLSYEWNDLQAAEQWAQESLNLGLQIGNEEFQVQATLVLARIEHTRGQTELAQQRCTTLLARLPAISPLRSHLCKEIQMTQARFSLALGDFSAVESWWASNSLDEELPLVQREREELLVARWRLAEGKATEALNSLVRLLDAAQHMGRTRRALEIQAVLVLVQHSCGHVQEARQSLQTLLARAHTEGYLRLFLDEGEVMTTLLRVTIPRLRERPLIAYVQTILRAAASAHAQQNDSPAPAYTLLAEPLSSQEQRVLRLLIAGHTNPEIARDLVVSVNTIKAHLKNIYRKLNVNNRLEACEAARDLAFPRRETPRRYSSYD
jgi:ATP/maltotriose-dependent transcriptional regulator MalT